MRIYVVQSSPEMLVDNQRNVKIGYYHHDVDGNETKYYLAATEEDDFKVFATEVSHNRSLEDKLKECYRALGDH